MRPAWLGLIILGGTVIAPVEAWMQEAFYPALLLILVIASLGIPIPEDIPLIVAGMLLRTDPDIATPGGTFLVAMLGIMTGDLILYTLGRRWGPDVVNHRSVRWIITPDRFARLSRRFMAHGTWFCFFGRFFMGVRAAMCLTAGATRFPYWRFFLADCAGAALSIPLFLCLGYWFASMLPTLKTYIDRVEFLLLVACIIAAVVVFFVYRARRRNKAIPPADEPS
jgi:membrane protein DedA with SNARE-associated domain